MTDFPKEVAVPWTPFDHAGEPYEWVAFPQKNGTTVMLLRRQGNGRSFGVVLGPNVKASTETARDGVDEFKEHLVISTSPPDDECFITSGPIPTAGGWVEFVVRVGSHDVVGTASPLGYGMGAAVDLDVGSAAMRAVSRYARDHRSEMTGLYRDAARLRRAAGNPPLAGTSRSDQVRLVQGPRAAGRGVVVRLVVGETPLEVMVFPEGGVIDDCDGWSKVTNEDRDTAFRIALDEILADRDAAVQLGLDPGLLEELWR